MEEQKKNRIKGVNIVFLVTVLLMVSVSFLPLSFLWEKPVLQIVFSQGLIALPAVIYMLVNRLPYAETVRLKKMKFTDILLSILFGILIQPAVTLLNALSMVFAENVIGVSMLEITGQVPFLAGIALLAVLPAVMEESIYRGVFYNEYSKIHPLKAALLSGLLFGIMHGNINQFSYAFFMGAVFALLIEATGSILSTMLVHFWTNASSVVMLYLYPKLYEIAKAYYSMYTEYENKEMVSLMESVFGDMTQSSSDWMEQMMGSAATLELTVGQVFMLYGPQALIMGVLAVLVYKKLAIRSGNWFRIRGYFVKQPAAGEQEAVQVKEKTESRMITVPLLIGLLLGVAYMVLYEVLL